MVKSGLIDLMAHSQEALSHKDIEVGVNCLLDQLSDAIVEGERVEIRNFGSFSLNIRAPRQARNPKTGEIVLTGEKRGTRFRPGKALRDRINESRHHFPIKDG